MDIFPRLIVYWDIFILRRRVEGCKICSVRLNPMTPERLLTRLSRFECLQIRRYWFVEHVSVPFIGPVKSIYIIWLSIHRPWSLLSINTLPTSSLFEPLYGDKQFFIVSFTTSVT